MALGTVLQLQGSSPLHCKSKASVLAFHSAVCHTLPLRQAGLENHIPAAAVPWDERDDDGQGRVNVQHALLGGDMARSAQA